MISGLEYRDGTTCLAFSGLGEDHGQNCQPSIGCSADERDYLGDLQLSLNQVWGELGSEGLSMKGTASKLL